MSKNFDKYSKIAPDYHYQQTNRRSLKRYNASVEARFKKLVEKVLEAADKKSVKILDVGCGDGVILSLITEAMPEAEIYGTDPSEEALEVAREKMRNGKFEKGLADKIPFENDFFDIVISSDVIEHVDEPEKMLEEIKRVTKPSSCIIVGTPIKHSKVPLDQNHVQEFFIEDFREMMQKHFKDVEMHESHNLSLVLPYNAPTRSFFNFKYLMNIWIFVSGKNPFMTERKNRIQMFAYMYAICKK